MKIPLSAILVLMLTVPGFAQNPQEETAWKEQMREAKASVNTASLEKWGGVGLLGTGAVLAVWGITSKQTDITVTSIFVRVSESPRWPVVAVGSGLAAGGLLSAVMGSRRLPVVHRKLDELEIHGRDNGWKLSVHPSINALKIALVW